jgi:hypothetical protein
VKVHAPIRQENKDLWRVVSNCVRTQRDGSELIKAEEKSDQIS